METKLHHEISNKIKKIQNELSFYKHFYSTVAELSDLHE